MSINTDELTGWNQALTQALAAVETPDFPSLLEKAIRQLVSFDLCMIFLYPIKGQASSLYHNAGDELGELVTDVYLSGPYLLDPFYGAVLKGKRTGFGAMRNLAPDQFYRSEFYRYHYVKTGIADEIGLFFPVSDQEIAVLSITRQRPKRYFSEQDRRRFTAINPVLQNFATRHWGRDGHTQRHSQSGNPGENPVSSVFDSFGRSVLTAREKEIIELVLKGHSSGSAGEVLGISTGTVKIHRKNAYEKLQISSQAELFSMFLDNLSRQLASTGQSQ